MIEAVQRPTIVLAPNKSLAAQLASEFRELFPKNRVEYFVSYYDYYQPEAYLPSTDTYIEKDSSINDEIDRLRHSATSAIMSRRDVIVVASVSAIYGLGAPDEYERQCLIVDKGEVREQRSILARLVELQYERNDVAFARNKFRVRGDTIEVFPSYEEHAVRLQLFGDEIERIVSVDPLTGELVGELDRLVLFPASHYVTSRERMAKAIDGIESELAERLAELERKDKLLEAQRLRMRTTYDLEMLREVGVCSGIENYSRHLDGRAPGEMPYTLLDYFPDDYVIVLDESHVTVPQLHGQYEGDRSRKETLVEHGFRLPSAMDNRPLKFDEFIDKVRQLVFMSATPSPYELEKSARVVEQIVRPTGLVDPEVIVRPTKGQIDDLVAEIRTREERDQRVLVTTLTKKMSEDLTDYLVELGVRVRYLHSEVDTLERVEILRSLRLGEFDVLVGINLLARGPRPARGVARRHPRRRQGGVPALLHVTHPDDRARGPQRRRQRDHVRRLRDRLDAPRPVGDEPAAARRSSPTTRSTGSTRRPSARASATSSRWCGPATAGRSPAAARARSRSKRRSGALRRVRPLRRATRRARAADPDAPGGDARGGQGSPLRGSRAPARRDHRAQARAPGRRVARRARVRAPLVGAPDAAPNIRSMRPRGRYAEIVSDSGPTITIRGAREHNLRERRPRAATRPPDRVHGPLGFREVVAGVRHDLRGGPAALRRVAVGVRAPVPRADGQARRRLHRGAVAGDLDRPEVGVAQPALDRRHDHRGLRLPAPALRAHRCPALPEAAGESSRARRRNRSSTVCSSSRRAPASRCSRPSCGVARASTTGCSRSSRHRASPARASTATSTSSPTRSRSRATSSTRSRWSSTGSCGATGIERRLTDSLETALRIAEGVAEVEIVPREGEEAAETLTFSEHLACSHCGLSFEELAPRNFSFNSPYGACERCDGLGTRFEVDPELVVPDDDRSLADGAIAPWIGVPKPLLRPCPRSDRRRVRVQHRDAVEEARQARPQRDPQRHGRPCRPREVQEPLRTTALVQHRVRGRHPVARASAHRRGERPVAGADRGLHARGAVPGVRRRAPAPGLARGDDRRHEPQRARRHVDLEGRARSSASSSSRSATG